jgi:MoxR-like ATPase
LLDEVSRANTTSNNILFPVLDKRRTLTLDIAMGEEQKIKVNDGVCFVATANIGSEYTGTTSLDPAFTGRFRVVTIDYMPDDAEIKILKLRKACDNKEGEIIVKVANHLRQLNREGELSTAVSVRNTLDAAEMVSGGLSLNHSLELAFLPVYMREEREAVLDVLSSF